MTALRLSGSLARGCIRLWIALAPVLKRIPYFWQFQLVVLLLFSLSSAAFQEEQASPVNLKADFRLDRPVQTLYQIEAQAAKTGWTGDLARSAGNSWQALGDLPRALAYWEVAARLSPTDLPLAKLIAQTRLDLQQWSGATLALNHVIELSPGDTWAHYHLGLLQAAFAPNDALEHLRLAGREALYRPLAADLLFIAGGTPDDPAFVQKVGLVFAAHELWAYAERAFQYTAALDSSFPEAWAYAGLARDRQGKDGSRFIEQALRLAPHNIQVLYLEGLHLRLRGNHEGSLMALFQAATLDPTNPGIAAELSSAYQLVGNITQAEQWLKQAVMLSNNDARFQNLLTLFYQQFPVTGS